MSDELKWRPVRRLYQQLFQDPVLKDDDLETIATDEDQAHCRAFAALPERVLTLEEFELYHDAFDLPPDKLGHLLVSPSALTFMVHGKGVPPDFGDDPP